MKRILLSLVIIACTLSANAKSSIYGEITIREGQTIQLDAYVPMVIDGYINGGRSSNTSIATISSTGALTGISTGVTKVRVDVMDPAVGIMTIYWFQVTVVPRSGGGTGSVGGNLH